MLIEKEKKFLEDYNPSDFAPFAVTVDIVVLGISKSAGSSYRHLDNQSLNVLLVTRPDMPYAGRSALPGGFVGESEGLDDAVRRILKKKTGLDDIYFEQLYTYGKPDRDPRMRVISCAYIALVDLEKTDVSYARWFDIETALDMELAFDHGDIISDALKRLKGKIIYTDIIFHIMPEQFTISELQEVYELILRKKLLPAAFRRTIADKIAETGEYTKAAGHRPSKLYRVKAGGNECL